MPAAYAAQGSEHDDWVAAAVSALLHALLLAFISIPIFRTEAKRTVLLTVETVQGITPQGEGTGVEGAGRQISDNPANANPLMNGLKLKMDEAALPTKAPKPKGKPRPAVQPPQSVEDLQKKYDSMPIGLKPRDGRESQDLSEGGMGNGRKAGSPDGIPGITGAIGGRCFTPPDLSFAGGLPEEAEVQISVVVSPLGEVIEARLEKTSGYIELNQFALAKARDFRFCPLPPAKAQENESGIIPLKFQYNGKGSIQ